MNKYSYFLMVWLFGLLLAQPSQAQYATTAPVRDGAISDAEYNANKFTTASGGTWYMTWDANYLYVAKTGGQNFEPNIMYLDLNPQVPVTGGGPAQGNLVGNRDFDVTPNLPFRGDVRVYFTDSYIEVRRATVDANGNETWSNAITTGLDISSTSTNRELRISWNTLTNGNGIPPFFNWLGYSSNNDAGATNYRYDLAPSNPSLAGTNGNSNSVNGVSLPSVEYYYTVLSTANGSATKPFSLKSYTFPRNTSVNNFGAIEVWDFTMNSPGQSISRGTNGGNWNISGSLVVNSGSVFFGSPAGGTFGTTNVGNIRMLGGILKMDQTNQSMFVREDVSLTGGSQFILSGVLGADLYVGRDFLVTNGTTTPATFQASDRAVIFSGNSVTHNIQTNNGYVIPFPYLTLNSPSGTVTLGSDIALGQLMTFTNGILFTGSHVVQMDGSALLGNETAASHITGNVRITQNLDPVNTTGFGNTGFRVIPQNGTSVQGSITLTRVTGTTIPNVGGGTNKNSIQRYFQVLANGTTFASPNYLLEFTYRLDELNGLIESNLGLYQSTTSSSGPYTYLTPTTASTSNHTISYNAKTVLAANSYFTVANKPIVLPVTLVSFSAQATAQGTALLRWTTASEVNSKGFGIERQLDASRPWQSVGYVASTNYATGSAYEFTDKSLATAPASTQAYYRLRQEDMDGTLSYSPVAVIARSASPVDATKLVLSPVPVSSGSLSLTFAEAGLAGSDVTVSNAQGQRMLHLTTEASTTEAVSLPVDQLVPGVYIVRVQVPGQEARYARFVKQ